MTISRELREVSNFSVGKEMENKLDEKTFYSEIALYLLAVSTSTNTTN